MPLRPPSAAAIRRARARYDAGEPIGDIARGLGVTDATFRRWRSAWGWPARRIKPNEPRPAQPVAEPGGHGTASVPPDLAQSLDLAQLIVAVRRAVQGELLRLASDETAPAGSEARSRALASLTRTLGILRALETQISGAGADQSDDHDTPPVDIAELRDELARRLGKLSAQRNDS